MEIKKIVHELEQASRLPTSDDSLTFLRDNNITLMWELAQVVEQQAKKIEVLEDMVSSLQRYG
jgi:hypothetical protein